MVLFSFIVVVSGGERTKEGEGEESESCTKGKWYERVRENINKQQDSELVSQARCSSRKAERHEE